MITLINHQGLKKVQGIQLQSPTPSIGLAYLGALLKKYNYSYTAIDACGLAMDRLSPYRNQQDLVIQGLSNSDIVKKVPDDTKIVGFSCLFSHCYPLVKDIFNAVKKKIPNAVFVIGGEHPTSMPGYVLKDGFDVVIAGEGEETFLELVTKIVNSQSWKSIHGIVYLDHENNLVKTPFRRRITEIEDIPYPDWDNWCIEEYISNQQTSGINLGRTMPILGSRGCPYACTFCSNEGMWTRRYIMRNPKSIVDEMAYYQSKYNISNFAFMDSTFIINKKKTLRFANELIHRKLDITYQLPAGTRCEPFDEELTIALEKSGLKNFALAPESGSTQVLKTIKKQINLETFYKVVRLVLKTDMTVACFIVIGFPYDNTKTLKSSLRLVRKLALMGVHDITVSQFTPYPGSIEFEKLIANGGISDKLEELDDIVDFYSLSEKSYCEEVPSKKLYRWMLWLYLNFYVISFIMRPWRVMYNFWTYFTKGCENTRYMRLFNELLINRRKWKTKK